MLKRLSLRWSLMLYVLAPLAVAMLVTGYVALKLWERQVESRMQSDLEMVARAIQLPLSHALERKRQGGIDQSLESAIAMDDVYSAYAFDMEGKEIAAAGRRDPDPEREKLTELASKGERTGEYGQVGERRVYSYFVPLVDSRDQTTGLLQLTRRERDLRNYIADVRQHALLWFGLGISLIAALVLIGQHQALGRHFQRLTAGMNRVAAGETGYRIPLSGPAEIRSIAASFNSMLESIQDAEREIERNRRAQDELKEQLRQSEKLAAVGQLAAGVAHELGTPLSTISGTAQRALRREKGTYCPGESFGRIQREVERMEIIVRQLLDFSHSRRLQRRELRPSRVVRSALAAVAEDATGHGVKLSATAGSAPPPSFSADPVRFEQVLVNLLRNAIQAEECDSVSLGWRIDGERIVFTVEDNGKGIPDDIRARMFEPFYTTKAVGSGTGLGLAVAHGIAGDHGGDIRVAESRPGRTRIEVIVPLNAPKRKAAV